MKRLFNTYTKVEDAILVVRSLMADGYSAYRQGLCVYIDDGGEDCAL